MADLSVVVINWNTCQLLDQVLASIYSNAADMDLEVIVVDNHSTDGSGQMVHMNYPQVILIENSCNLGFARGNNLGYQACSAPLTLFLNSDTIVQVGALPAMVAKMRSNPKVGVLGPRLLNADGSIQISALRFPSLAGIFAQWTYDFPLLSRLKLRERVGNMYPSYAVDMSVDWVSGACLLIRQEAVEAIGGKPWDERFYMYSEDVDLCYRVRNAGYEVLYFTDAEVVHLGRQSSQQVLEWSTLEQYVSQARFWYLHRGVIRAATFLVETTGLLALRALLLTAGGLVKVCKGQPAQSNWHRIALNWQIIRQYGTYLVRPNTLWEDKKEQCERE